MKHKQNTSMATVKVALDPRVKKDDPNKKILVCLKVFYQSKWRAYGIDLYLTPVEFELYEANSKKANIKAFNRIATEQIAKANQIIDSLGEDFTFLRFKEALKGKIAESKPSKLYDYFEKVIEEKKVDPTKSTYKFYENTLSSLKAYRKSNPEFKEIDVPFLNGYKEWFLTTPFGRKNKLRKVSSLSMYLRTLRAVLNMAIDDGLMRQEQYPFSRRRNDKRKAKIPSTRNIKKALRIEDVKKIAEYQAESDSEAFYRDVWYFSYLCDGMNLKDIALLEYNAVSENGIRVIRAKTKNTIQKPKFIPLIDQSKAIIEKWGNADKSPDNRVFNLVPKDTPDEKFIATKNQVIKMVNKYMGEIFKKLKLGDYVGIMSARHTCATVLKRKGTPIAVISDKMHNGNVGTTQVYLDDFEDDALFEIQKRLVDF